MADKRRTPAGTNNQPKDAVEFYREFLTTKTCVVAGDFNYHIPEEELGEMGLASASSSQPRGTHYHKGKLDRPPFAVDYMFVPRRGNLRLTRFEVGKPELWIGKDSSDHVPLIADLDTARGSTLSRWMRRPWKRSQ